MGTNDIRRARVPLSGIFRSPGVLLLSLVAALVFALPVASVVVGAVADGGIGQSASFNTTSLVAVLTDPVTWKAFGNSIVLTVFSVVIGVVLAVVLAWLSVRSDAPLRQLITPAMAIVFAVPQLYYALSWQLLGMNPSGSLNMVWKLLTGASDGPFDVISWPGLIFVMALKIAAIIYMLLLGPMGSVDASLDEAARISGAGKLRSFVEIELPVLAPTLLSATVLSVVISLGVLDIPLILGTPAEIQTLSTQIYYLLNGRIPADYSGANTIGLLVMLCVAVPVLAQNVVLRGRKFTTVGGKSFRRARIELKRWRPVAGVGIAVVILVMLVLPLGQLLLSSLQPYAGVYTNLSFAHYQAVLTNPRVLNGFGISLWFGVVGGFVAAAIALLLSIVAARAKSRFRGVPQGLALLVLSVPGITIALGILSIVLLIAPLHPLYGTVIICLAALVIAFTPIANRLTVGAIAQVGPEMEEAARMSGAGVVRSTVEILVRLVMPTFLAAWFVTGVIISGNLEMPALLSSPGTEPITLVALQTSQTGSSGQAAAIACLMLLAIAVPLIVALIVRAALNARTQRQQRELDVAARSATPEPESPNTTTTTTARDEETPAVELVASVNESARSAR